MNNRNVVLVVLVFLLVAALAIILWWSNNKKTYSWTENYSDRNLEEPYGKEIIESLAEDYFPEYEFIRSSNFPPKKTLAKENVTSPANYIYIGQKLRLDSSSTATLMQFITEGNTVLMAANDLPKNLVEALMNKAIKGRNYYKNQQVKEEFSEPIYDEYYYSEGKKAFRSLNKVKTIYNC